MQTSSRVTRFGEFLPVVRIMNDVEFTLRRFFNRNAVVGIKFDKIICKKYNIILKILN
jgi:hypothetical protein